MGESTWKPIGEMLVTATMKPNRPFILASAFKRGGRVGVLLATATCVLWAGATTAHALKSLLAGPKPIAGQDPIAAARLPLSPLDGIGSGLWTIADMPWSVELTQVGQNELAARLAIAVGEANPAGRCSPQESELLALCRMACNGPFAHQGGNVYVLDGESLRVRVFSRNIDGQERMMGGYVACPRGDEGWSLLIIRPATGANGSVTGLPGLLPLPASAERIGARWSPQGQLQCEIVSFPGRPDEATALWLRRGWAIEHLSSGDDGEIVTCRLGKEQIQVCGSYDSSLQQSRLILIRVP
jgi:hypothetical protein